MRFSALRWVVQVWLALVFVFAGGMKLVLPIEKLRGRTTETSNLASKLRAALYEVAERRRRFAGSKWAC